MRLSPAQWSGQEESHIQWLSDRHGLVPQVVRAWRAMAAAANRDGLELNLVSSFRSFSRQKAIWNSKWLGERPVLNDQQQAIDLSPLSELEKALAILRFSALPGTSRHHWGTDLDLYSARLQVKPLQLVASEYQVGGPQYNVSQWLDKRAAEFEFYRPYSEDLGGVACEPWHLSYAPLSESIAKNITPSQVAQRLAQSGLQGQSVVLENIEMLLERFSHRVASAAF